MIVTEKMAQEAWDHLRTYARMSDEKWDQMASLSGWANESNVKAAFHAASRQTHPDMGGSAEAFAAVDRAKHVLLEWLKRAPAARPVQSAQGEPCDRCGGAGWVSVQRAWKAMRVTCQRCRGTGDLSNDDRGTYDN